VNLPGQNDFAAFFQYVGLKTARVKGLHPLRRSMKSSGVIKRRSGSIAQWRWRTIRPSACSCAKACCLSQRGAAPTCPACRRRREAARGKLRRLVRRPHE
jgi:hypothetical protein